jgi:basic membrane protein A
MKKLFAVLSLVVVLSMALTACGAKTPVATEPAVVATEPPVVATEPPAVATEPPAVAYRVGFVTDTAGIADMSFNQTQWEGIQRAGTDFGIDVQYAQSTEASQYTPNLTTFASEGYDLVIAAGFFLANDLAVVSAQFPDTEFVIADYSYPNAFDVAEGNPGHDACIPNVMGQIYKTDQPAYLAGYLAAGMAALRDPADPKIGFFGGAKIPTVTIFGVGLQMGIEAYNAAHGTSVKLLGWDNATGEGTFTNNFTDMTVAQQAATSLFDEGSDIVIGVGGLIGSVVWPLAKERGALGMWVDTDGTVQFPDSADVILTSVMKNMAQVHYDVIKNAMEGTFNGCGTYIGEMSNNGVQLGEFGTGIEIPADLLAEVDAIKAQMVDGTLTDAGCISYSAWCPAGLYPTP